MIKKSLLLSLYIFFWIGSLHSQQLVSVSDLYNTDEYLNKIVSITGTVDRHAEIDTTIDVRGYILRDQFGEEVMVRTIGDYPTVNRTYTITGSFEEGPSQGNRRLFFIREESRSVNGNYDLHTVRISSLPIGATVEMNGSAVGNTPYSARLSDGNYTFRIQKPFYESRTIGLVVNGNSVERNLDLDRNLIFYLITGGGILLFLLIGGFIFNSFRGNETPEPIERKNSPSQPAGGSTSSTSFENKTIKISNPSEKTVKIVPGRFEILSGIDEISELRLHTDPSKGKSEYTFGRDPGRSHYHFQLKSNTVSRNQAKLIVTKNDYTLINYSETNPTVINGEPLDLNDSHMLNSGDIVEMGEIKMRFEK